MKKIVLILFAALTLFSTGCTQARQSGPALRTGDLVFVQIPSGYDLDSGSMADAIGASTSGGDSLMTIHVAILEVQGDSLWIIDATLRHGVDRHPLDTMLCDFTLKDGSLPKFVVKRPLLSEEGARRDVENAKKFIGQPYDVHFLPDNGAMYCSELVQCSYLKEDGTHLFEQYPMNFLDSDGKMPVYWTELFALLGEKVPQGVMGTNPQRMFLSPSLSFVREGF